MNKLIVISAIAAISTLTSGSVLATSHDFAPGGTVPVICNATTFTGDFDFTEQQIKDASGSLDVDFKVTCNSANDAVVKLKSSNGWLENQSNASFGVKYQATLDVADANNINLVLDADNTSKPKISELTMATNAQVATGVDAKLTVDLTSGWGNSMAGDYADNLLLTITAL